MSSGSSRPRPLSLDERRAVLRFGLLCAALLFIKVLLWEKAMGKQAPYAEHSFDANQRPTTGRSTGPGYTITWAGSTTPDAADPQDVLKAVISRMERLQASAAGSDRLAKALWNVDQAVRILEGREVTDVGALGGPGAGFQGKDG